LKDLLDRTTTNSNVGGLQVLIGGDGDGKNFVSVRW